MIDTIKKKINLNVEVDSYKGELNESKGQNHAIKGISENIKVHERNCEIIKQI
jgi:hypothetical protein